MRACIAAFAVAFALLARPAGAQEICGEAPPLPHGATAEQLHHAVFGLALSSAAGAGFVAHARVVYGDLVKGRSAADARLLAVALLQAYCAWMLQHEDPARLPWHMKSQLAGMAQLVPDFREANALLDRIAAAERAPQP
jgi:hypothetical protein